MLITLGLSLNWHQGWNKLIVRGLIPVAAIKLLLLPLLVYAMVMMLGPIGKLTSTSLIMFALIPSTLYGLVLCERYKLETNAYTAALTFTTVISLVMIPIVHGIKLF